MNDALLNSYLKMYRRRTGLSQDDVAYLLGLVEGTTVSRHETGKRIPSIRTLIAYEVILGKVLAELYEGIAEEVREKILHRVRALKLGLERRAGGRLTRKIEYLGQLMEHHRLMASLEAMSDNYEQNTMPESARD